MEVVRADLELLRALASLARHQDPKRRSEHLAKRADLWVSRIELAMRRREVL